MQERIGKLPFSKSYNFNQYQNSNVNEVHNSTDAEMVAFRKGHHDYGGGDMESSIILSSLEIASGCPTTTSSHCLRCNNDGCIKCALYLVSETRQCVDQCPSGYIDQWSTHTVFMGKICIANNYSGPIIAALVGLLGGFFICLSLITIVTTLLKRKCYWKFNKQNLFHDTTESADFLRELNKIRPSAEYFLALLNDTRRQMRKLYLSRDAVTAHTYRPLLRDLTKILILLNRPVEFLAPPHDWYRLYSWSEQVIEQYTPQTGQLIDFFQMNSENDNLHSNSQHNKLKSFSSSEATREYKHISNKRDIYKAGDSNFFDAQIRTQKYHIFDSLNSLYEFEEPLQSNSCRTTFTTPLGVLISDISSSSLWFEDDFYKLGFRPQDVITTEL